MELLNEKYNLSDHFEEYTINLEIHFERAQLSDFSYIYVTEKNEKVIVSKDFCNTDDINIVCAIHAIVTGYSSVRFYSQLFQRKREKLPAISVKIQRSFSKYKSPVFFIFIGFHHMIKRHHADIPVMVCTAGRCDPISSLYIFTLIRRVE